MDSIIVRLRQLRDANNNNKNENNKEVAVRVLEDELDGNSTWHFTTVDRRSNLGEVYRIKDRVDSLPRCEICVRCDHGNGHNQQMMRLDYQNTADETFIEHNNDESIGDVLSSSFSFRQCLQASSTPVEDDAHAADIHADDVIADMQTDILQSANTDSRFDGQADNQSVADMDEQTDVKSIAQAGDQMDGVFDGQTDGFQIDVIADVQTDMVADIQSGPTGMVADIQSESDKQSDDQSIDSQIFMDALEG